MKKGMKRLVSCLLTIAMVLTLFGVNTKTASAEERTMQNYVYEGYVVDFELSMTLSRYMIFDDDGHTVWIMWYKGVAA